MRIGEDLITGNHLLILGGSRSGKSEFAENLALREKGPVFYLATGVVTDGEMEERVKSHQKRRPSHWETIEEPLQLEMIAKKLRTKSGILLVDSLAGWLTNLFYEDNWENWQWGEDKEDQVLARVRGFLAELNSSSLGCLIVGDEVGMGLVPPTPEGRAFRDLNGKANQLVAAWAHEVYFVVAGLATKIK